MSTQDAKTICVLTSDARTAERISAALASGEDFAPSVVCRDLTDLAAYLDRSAAAAAVVDIDAEPRRMLAELEPVTHRFERTRFVVLASDMDGPIVLDAMQAGARHFVVKQAIEADLYGVLRRLLSTNGAARSAPTGRILTVLSAAGGCGATTLAVNLAEELQLIGDSASLLIDLDDSYGGVASYLGLEGQFGLGDVLTYRGQIDAQLISSTALRYSDRLHALINPISINYAAPAPLPWEQLDHTLKICRQTYRWTVIDAPRVPIDIAERLAHASRLTLIVFQLAVKDVRIARALWEALTDRGIPAESIRLVANRYRRRGTPVDLDDAAHALHHLKPTLIRNDFRRVARGVNFGQLLSGCAPRSAARRDIQRLARELAQPQPAHAALNTGSSS